VGPILGDAVLRAALFQGPARPGEVISNISTIAAVAGRAVAAGAQILVTPEMSVTGYNVGELSAGRAESANGSLFGAMASVAAENGIAIVYGYPEITEGGRYNAIQVVGPSGKSLARHHKVHLYGELDRDLFVPGKQLVSQFNFGGFTCGLTICYDVEFPELVRAHADAGTDVLLAPAALTRDFEVVSRIIVPARAYENQLFIGYVNRCDAEDGLEYCGLSCVIGPDGADRARAGAYEELLIADFDRAALDAGRAVNTHLADRRIDLYRGPTGAALLE
jgi:nitrilase